jgi:hypothetical protein
MLRRGNPFLAGMTTSLARGPRVLEGDPGVLTGGAAGLAVKGALRTAMKRCRQGLS